MALPFALVGPLKLVLRSAVKKLALSTLDGTVKATANTILEKGFSDSQALILNRLKTYPTKTFYEYASKELGLPVNEVRKVVKFFDQTPQMREAAIGRKFTKILKSRLKQELGIDQIKNELGINKLNNLKAIQRRLAAKNAKERLEDAEKTKDKKYNDQVKSRLNRINKDLNSRIDSFVDGFGSSVEFSIDTRLIDLYDENEEYTIETIKALDNLELSMAASEVSYKTGDNLILSEYETGSWKKYGEDKVNNFIQNIIADTVISLDTR